MDFFQFFSQKEKLINFGIDWTAKQMMDNFTNPFAEEAVGGTAGGVTEVSNLATEGAGEYAKGGKELRDFHVVGL